MGDWRATIVVDYSGNTRQKTIELAPRHWGHLPQRPRHRGRVRDPLRLRQSIRREDIAAAPPSDLPLLYKELGQSCMLYT